MATTTKKTTKKTAKKTTKKTAKVTERPERTAPAVDPFAQTLPSATKKAPVGDNIHSAPSNDEELGNVASDIAEFAKAKAEYKAAEARFKAVSGTVMSYAKRVLLDLFSKNGSKPKSQKLVGDGGAIVTTYYQDRSMSMHGDNAERYVTVCDMFGKEIADAELAEFIGFSIPESKMQDTALIEKMKKVLQEGMSDDGESMTAEELSGLFVAKHVSRKGVVDKASKLCDGDTDKIDQLLQLTVPKPTLK